MRISKINPYAIARAAFGLLAALATVVWLSSCGLRRAVYYAPPSVRVDTLYVQQTETLTVEVAGAVVRDTVPVCDTIMIPITRVDSTGRAQLRWYRDKYNRLVAECTAASAKATATNATSTRAVSRREEPPDLVAMPTAEKPTPAGYFWGAPWWLWLIFAAVIAVVISRLLR